MATLFIILALIVLCLLILITQQQICKTLRYKKPDEYIFIQPRPSDPSTNTVNLLITRVWNGQTKSRLIEFDKKAHTLTGEHYGPVKTSSLDLNDLSRMGIMFDQTPDTLEILHQFKETLKDLAS